MQSCSMDCYSEAHRDDRCVKVAIAVGLSKNCLTKYWMTDRGPNRIRTFLQAQKFLTPIYASSMDQNTKTSKPMRQI